jgi:hypothetical protein
VIDLPGSSARTIATGTAIVQLALDPTGDRIAVVGDDRSLVLFDASGAVLARDQIRATGDVASIAWVDGLIAVVGTTWLEARRDPALGTVEVGATFDGKLFVAPDARLVLALPELTSLAPWTARGRATPLHLRATLFGGARATAFTDDVLHVGRLDGAIQMWNRADWSDAGSFHADDRPIDAIAVRGRLLATLANRTLRIWDLDTRRAIYEQQLDGRAQGAWFVGNDLLVHGKDGSLDLLTTGVAPTVDVLATYVCAVPLEIRRQTSAPEVACPP